jgi:hypothetical protein
VPVVTLAEEGWTPFGVADEEYPEPDKTGIRWLHLGCGKGPKEGRPRDQAGQWLRSAMIALGLLAAAAAVVSFEAQYRMVYAAKGVKAIAAPEAGIPDMSAVVFASLGIALALHGKRALRARALNVAAVATSIGMNFLAATGGSWRDVAIWVMPSVAYAVASDTAIGVIRAYEIARQRQLHEDLADDEATPLAAVGRLLLWCLRLVLAPRSTLAGFRDWVLQECPVAPGRRAVLPASPNVAALSAASPPGSVATAKPAKATGRACGPRRESKTARFQALVDARYPDGLHTLPVERVASLCGELAPQVDLNEGSARSYLLHLARQAHADAQEGGQS